MCLSTLAPPRCIGNKSGGNCGQNRRIPEACWSHWHLNQNKFWGYSALRKWKYFSYPFQCYPKHLLNLPNIVYHSKHGFSQENPGKYSFSLIFSEILFVLNGTLIVVQKPTTEYTKVQLFFLAVFYSKKKSYSTDNLKRNHFTIYSRKIIHWYKISSILGPSRP